MEGVVSPGRRGRRCQSSSVRKGMKGWIIAKPPSRAVYSVSFALLCSSSVPLAMIAFEFSIYVSQRWEYQYW